MDAYKPTRVVADLLELRALTWQPVDGIPQTVCGRPADLWVLPRPPWSAVALVTAVSWVVHPGGAGRFFVARLTNCLTAAGGPGPISSCSTARRIQLDTDNRST